MNTSKRLRERLRATLCVAAALTPALAGAELNCPGAAPLLLEAAAVSGTSRACYRFQVPEGSPFVRLQVTAGGSPLDLYFSPGLQASLSDWDRVNAQPVDGDAKFVMLEPDAGDYTVAVAPGSGAGRFSLLATAAVTSSGDGPKTTCVGDICTSTMPMTLAPSAVVLGPEFGDRVVFPLTVTGVGTVKVDARWNGSAGRLALILNGPERPELSNPGAYYARRDGGSPLSLTYTVTAEDVERGRRFWVSLVNFSGGEALGSVEITKPKRFHFAAVSRLALAELAPQRAAPLRPTRIRARPGPGAPAAEEACHGLVQGKIAWNYEDDKRWLENNVKRLCRGTAKAAEPATCFRLVMHGGIDWGGGTRWQWENAVDLCEGTHDAARTIECFGRRIRAGDRWQAAIRACETR